MKSAMFATAEEVDGIGVLFEEEIGCAPSPDPRLGEEARTLSNFTSSLLKAVGGKAGLKKLLTKSVLRTLPIMLNNPMRHEKAMFGVYAERFMREMTGWGRGEVVREHDGKKTKINVDFRLPYPEDDPRSFVFDLRCTMGREWTIPSEAIGEVCLLVRLVPSGCSRFLSCGALVALPENIRAGGGVGGRAGIRRDAKKKIRWIIGGESSGVRLRSVYEGRDLVDLSARLIEAQVDGAMTVPDAIRAGEAAVTRAELMCSFPERRDPAGEEPHIDWEGMGR